MQLLIEGEFFMERFSGKGGWTFVRLPISQLGAKTQIRTQIKKEEGEKVLLRLYRNGIPDQLTDELKDCLLDDPGKLELYQALPATEQARWLEMIYSAGDEEQKAERIVRLLEYLGKLV